MGTMLMPVVKPTKRSWWVDFKIFCVAVLIGSPAAVGAGYLAAQYQKSTVEQATSAPPTTTPFAIPDIIVEVKPTRVETETVVVSPPPRIPETQRTRSRHAAPEPKPSIADVPPVIPQQTSVIPQQTTTPGTHRAPAQPTPTLTPVYDQLRSETVTTDPTLESEIPE